MNKYSDGEVMMFAHKIDTVCQNFKGSPLTAESMYYLQLELDNLLLEWKLRMGFLPEVEGDCGTGTLKRLVIKQDGSDSIYVYYEIEEDEKFVRKRDAIAQELMAMPGGEHLGEWR
jgi:hypothetical protein